LGKSSMTGKARRGYDNIRNRSYVYRCITIVSTTWTKSQYLGDQDVGGEKGYAGGAFWYVHSGGSTISVSFAIGYGVGSVSVSVPLGQSGAPKHGVQIPIKVTGYYKIKAKKVVKMRVVITQYQNAKGKWYNHSVAKSHTELRAKAWIVIQ